jgi:hypothetical protein
VTSIYEKPAAVRDLPKPRPKPPIADPWHLVIHPTDPAVRTYFRHEGDANDRVLSLMLKYGERLDNAGRPVPRAEVVDGLPEAF